MENSEENRNNAAAAREARRKRILENTNNRLSKITGRVHNEEVPKIEEIPQTNGIYDDPDFERDVFEGTTSIQSLNSHNNQDVFELLKTLQQDKNKTSEESPTQQQQNIQQSPFSKFLKSKYPIIILALIVYAFFALNIEAMIGSSVFILLILFEITQFVLTTFIIKEPAQQNQITVLISMFLGLNAHSLDILIKILALLNKILRDIATFIFSFVFIHLFYSLVIAGDSMSEILDKDFYKLLTKDEF